MPAPHLLPRIESEVQLLELAAGGLLHEPNLGIEFKREIESNKEIAKELASLAVDGGQLLLGVVDQKHRPPNPTPEQHLNALPHPDRMAERVDNIARSRVTPILHIVTRYILSQTDSQKGYVVVDVPQSADAPHMVDNRYWGRTGTGKYAMPDHEVRAHLDQRPARSQEARAELEAFVERTPPSLFAPDADQQDPDSFNGPLHVVVVPTVARDDQAYQAWSQAPSSPDDWLVDIAKRSAIEHQTRTWLNWPRTQRASARYILSNEPFERTGEPKAQTSDQHSNGMLWFDVRMIELTKRGVIRAYDGTAVEVGQWVGNGPVRRIFHLGETLETIRNVINFAAITGDQIDYGGTWSIAIEIAGLQDASITVSGPTPAEARYRAETTAATSEMTKEPGTVIFRLVDDLLWPMGIEDRNEFPLAFGAA